MSRRLKLSKRQPLRHVKQPAHCPLWQLACR
jgi:hypothetical protein